MMHAASYPSAFQRTLITLSVMMSVFMVSLDGTIAIIALPQIQSSTASSAEQIAWVLTSYLIAMAIMTPLSGWLAERFGRKRVMLLSTLGFTITSIGCGLSANVSMLVAFRLAQGLTGAGLVPLAQAEILDITPPERHASALATYGLGVLVAPLIGPALGGWLTDTFSWRLVFLINVPFGLLGLAGMSLFMRELYQPRARSFDRRGFAALALFLGAFQLLLDRGQLLDWFSSREIWIETALAGLGLWVFVVHSLTCPNPFLKPAIFADRNFLLGALLATLIGVFVVGVVPIVTDLMEQLMGYPVMLTGWLSMPRAVGNIIVAGTLGRIIARADVRVLITLGMGIHVFSLWLLTHISLESDQTIFALVAFLQGAGSGCIFVPLSIIVFATLAPELRNEGATLFALTRNLGASAGISVLQATIVRHSAVAHARLVEAVRPDSPIVAWRMPDLDVHAPLSLAGVEGMVMRQAEMLAYLDAFRILLVIGVVMSPLALLMRRQATGGAPASAPAAME